MGSFLIRNSLNPGKVVQISTAFHQQILKTGNHDGELVWIIELGTEETNPETGERIPSEFIHTTSLKDIDKEIQKAASVIASKVNWMPLVEDMEAPYVDSVSPSEYLMDIDDNVYFTLKEDLPSAGIDKSSITMTINGVDVSTNLLISGDPYEYNVEWRPIARIREIIEEV